MSIVTNAILSIDSLSEDEDAKCNEINRYLDSMDNSCFVSADSKTLPDRWYGGGKRLEANLYLAAINHLDLNGLLQHIRNMNWKGPVTVQLLIKEHEESSFKSFIVVDKGW